MAEIATAAVADKICSIEHPEETRNIDHNEQLAVLAEVATNVGRKDILLKSVLMRTLGCNHNETLVVVVEVATNVGRKDILQKSVLMRTLGCNHKETLVVVVEVATNVGRKDILQKNVLMRTLGRKGVNKESEGVASIAEKVKEVATAGIGAIEKEVTLGKMA